MGRVAQSVERRTKQPGAVLIRVRFHRCDNVFFLPESVLILLQCVNSHTVQPSCANGMHQHQRARWKSPNTGSCCCGCGWSLLYSAILRFRADSLRSHVILHEWLAFYSAFLNIHRSGVRTYSADMSVYHWILLTKEFKKRRKCTKDLPHQQTKE